MVNRLEIRGVDLQHADFRRVVVDAPGIFKLVFEIYAIAGKGMIPSLLAVFGTRRSGRCSPSSDPF